MKIAYVYLMLRKNQVGVETKLRRQARAIASVGLTDLELFVLNPSRQEKVDGVNFVKLRSLPFPLNYFEYAFRRYDLIARSLDLEKYDYIILRYPLADRSGIEFMQKYRVVTEHHTKEPPELLSKLKATASPLERVTLILSLILEKKHAVKVLRNCRGFIAVSDETRLFQLKRAQISLPAITVGNGIEVESIPHTGFNRFDGEKLDVVFIASFFRPWDGLDRVINSFNRYQGSVRLTLHLIGNIDQEELGSSSPNLSKVRFYGTKTGKELNDIMRNMHLAVSTMSLHRKNLCEGSQLKTIEYIARGIPFLLAHKEPDLLKVDDEFKFYLRFENDDSLLDVQKIIDFARQVSLKRDTISAYMRAYALEHLDWHIKLKQYLDFVNSLA